MSNGRFHKFIDFVSLSDKRSDEPLKFFAYNDMAVSLGPFQYKDRCSWKRKSNHKEKTVMRPSYLYNGWWEFR